MISPRKLQANLANAKASTGPKTLHGKARSAQNAFWHGLSTTPVYADPGLSQKVESLTHKIAGGRTSTQLVEMARKIAEAQIELSHIRAVRNDLINREMRDRDFRPCKIYRPHLKQLHRFIRTFGPDAPVPDYLAHPNSDRLSEDERFVAVISDLSPKLVAIDRYEQRALSRRKLAIRKFTEAIDKFP